MSSNGNERRGKSSGGKKGVKRAQAEGTSADLDCANPGYVETTSSDFDSKLGLHIQNFNEFMDGKIALMKKQLKDFIDFGHPGDAREVYHYLSEIVLDSREMDDEVDSHAWFLPQYITDRYRYKLHRLRKRIFAVDQAMRGEQEEGEGEEKDPEPEAEPKHSK